MSKKTIDINDIIFEKIKFRYEFISYELRRIKKVGSILMDSFYPAEIGRALINQRDLSNVQIDRGYCISQGAAKELNQRKLHVSELTTMLGYTKTDITKLLQIVKNRRLSATLVGLGGTGSNFLHWMYEICEWTGKTKIFKRVISYDDDYFDIPNMLRIPFLPENNTITSSKKTNCIPKKYMIIAEADNFIEKRMTKEDMSKYSELTNTHFIYGAPDIKTRSELSKEAVTFFAATHRDNEYSVVANPDVDNELMVETYGKINLSFFFLNHLSMTIKFLEYLAEGNPLSEVGKNQEIFKHDFDEIYKNQIDNGFKSGSKKLFPVQATDNNRLILEIPENRRDI